MSDNDDLSFQYDNALDVTFQYSDEDSDGSVEENITHLLGYDKEAEGKGKKHSEGPMWRSNIRSHRKRFKRPNGANSLYSC